MIYHRTSTFLHIMASTAVNCCQRKISDKNADEIEFEEPENVGQMIELAKRLGRLGVDDRLSHASSCSELTATDEDDDVKTDHGKHRTLMKLRRKQQRARRQREAMPAISVAFQRRFQQLTQELDSVDADVSKIQRKVLGKDGTASVHRTDAAIRMFQKRRITRCENGYEYGNGTPDGAETAEQLEMVRRSGNTELGEDGIRETAIDADRFHETAATPSHGNNVDATF